MRLRLAAASDVRRHDPFRRRDSRSKDRLRRALHSTHRSRTFPSFSASELTTPALAAGNRDLPPRVYTQQESSACRRFRGDSFPEEQISAPCCESNREQDKKFRYSDGSKIGENGNTFLRAISGGSGVRSKILAYCGAFLPSLACGESGPR